MPIIRGDALVGNVVDVLPLHGVAVDSVDHVSEVDEEICAKKSLPKVHGSAHFSHQLDEQGRATKREDSIHEAIDVVRDSETRWGLSRDLDRLWILDVEVGVVGFIQDVIRRCMCHDSHGSENDEQVDENSSRSQPSQSLQRPDLSNEAARDCADHNADNEAQIELGQLADRLATAEDYEGNVQEELE